MICPQTPRSLYHCIVQHLIYPMILMILMLNPMGLNQTRSSQSYPIKTACGEPLYLSRRHTFLLHMHIQGLLAKDLLVSDKAGLEYLLTFRISQDHLEGFFRKVGSMGAGNNNPNAIQVKAALRRVLA